ncbi:hypothetical protein KM043_014402 [Ampulex compressa]|nr:hypothetical protein KM043_014402 [Ampulex compressa]
MVMAGNEGAPGTLAEDSLSARLQWLRQRREALQEKLAQKNNELKNLCVEEAELTGVLPPEIPLEPGESPPTFRRRVGTTFVYPQNLINKLKTNEAEESALELERQVQSGIVEAALAIVNDSTESKAVRRKHRLVYQQSQRRLQELDARLNFLRQSRGKTHRTQGQFPHPTVHTTQLHPHTGVKHRTKKPRPPLDNAEIIHESGISLSPLGSGEKCSIYPSHEYEEQLTIPNVCNHNHNRSYSPTSPIDHRQNIKILDHDHNDNHNIYILPDQYRARTYSHGSGGSRSQPEVDRTYRPVPNTYSEEERQLRYRQFHQQQQKLHLREQLHDSQYPDYKHLDNEISRRPSQAYYDKDFRATHYANAPDLHMYYKNSMQPQSLQRRDRDSCGSKNLRYAGSTSETQIPCGYWMRYEDEIVWCSDEQSATDRFGSLDRRKSNAQVHGGGIINDAHLRYRTVSAGYKSSTSTVSHQTPSVHLLPLTEQQSASNKMLLRTQSLGSVETWHSGNSLDSHDAKEAADSIIRRNREKEWYETSLDSGASPGLDLSPIGPHRNVQYRSSPPTGRAKLVASGNEEAKNNYGSSVNRRKKEVTIIDTEPHLQSTQFRYEHTRKKTLEIPAESKPSVESNEDGISMGTSKNCTIVQAGKYQPYREITKPFEMSDFYKYSTKFRKRSEAAGQLASTDIQKELRTPQYIGSSEMFAESSSSNFTHNGAVASPVQKRIYQPVQRMTCQPYLTSLR